MLIDLIKDQDFEAPVYISSAIEKTTKNGKKYITGELKDKSLILKYNLWDSDNVSYSLPKAGTYAMVKGKLELFNDSKQVNILSIKTLDQQSIDLTHFQKQTTRNIDELWKEFNDLVKDLKDPFIKYISVKILEDESVVKLLKNSPAARTIHNAWIGGLLEHSVSVAKLAVSCIDYYNKNYFKGKLNRDIVLFGCLFHDIGKIWEFDNSTPEIKSTVLGELLGHIYIGAKKIEDIAKDYSSNKNQLELDSADINLKLNQLIHLILSHHGKLEFGSPVNPKTPEAIMVHYLDNLDTRIMNAWENLSDCKDEFTQRIFIQENTKLFNTLK